MYESVGGDRQILDHSSIYMNSTNFQTCAAVCFTRTACDATATAKIWKECKGLSFAESLNAINIDEFAGEFMAEYSWIIKIWLRTLERMQIRSADPYALDLYYCLIFRQLRFFTTAVFKVSWCGARKNFHSDLLSTYSKLDPENYRDGVGRWTFNATYLNITLKITQNDHAILSLCTYSTYLYVRKNLFKNSNNLNAYPLHTDFTERTVKEQEA